MWASSDQFMVIKEKICFPDFSSRKHGSVDVVLGSNKRPATVVLSDGYGAYYSFATRMGMMHAEYWTHTRQELLKVEK